MHIQYGGRYQHVLTYSGHNNALRITYGQKFQKVENDENRFFAITSSKLFKN